MARKDDIFKSFLDHDIIESRYLLNQEVLPKTVREGLNSNIPVVKAIALIVDGLERSPSTGDNQLKDIVLRFLNEAI
jgi:hypothetical protein